VAPGRGPPHPGPRGPPVRLLPLRPPHPRRQMALPPPWAAAGSYAPAAEGAGAGRGGMRSGSESVEDVSSVSRRLVSILKTVCFRLGIDCVMPVLLWGNVALY